MPPSHGHCNAVANTNGIIAKTNSNANANTNAEAA
jgi:hypothetical protein